MQPAAFDTYAGSYDDHFTFSPIGKMQRERVYHFLKPYLSSPQSILELNCGTGHDAIHFAQQGHQVHAIDISESMIAIAKAKAKDHSIQFESQDIRSLQAFPEKQYNRVFSNFGGLNCLNQDELKILSETLSRQLNSNGFVSMVIMGSACKWEDFYFKRIKSAHYQRRQIPDGVMANIDGHVFKTWYYRPQQIIDIFKTHFIVEKVKPIGLFVPPSYLNAYFSKKPFVLNSLYAIDKIIAHAAWMANYADHYIIVLKKK
jgi:ubiquinone/menaquinone biosynthesis C-methylase UbiE